MNRLAFLLLLLPISTLAQYSGPESVEHDAVGQRYFISNTASNAILQRSYAGTVSNFATGLPVAPYGLELQGDTLFACMGGAVHGFATATGAEVFSLDLGGVFLNGITSDGTALYVTDFSAKKILKVNVAQGTFQTLVANTGTTPNGIVWDPAMARLWVANWGSNAKIKAYDRVTGQELESHTTALANLDGITLDCQGRILVSSWSPDRISQFEHTFSIPPVALAISGLDNPADIDFDEVNDRVCVPNSGNNTVVFAEVMDCVALVNGPDGPGSITVWPVPADGLLEVDLHLQHPETYRIFSTDGRMAAMGILEPMGRVNLLALAPGAYVLDIPSLGRRARFIRR